MFWMCVYTHLGVWLWSKETRRFTLPWNRIFQKGGAPVAAASYLREKGDAGFYPSGHKVREGQATPLLAYSLKFHPLRNIENKRTFTHFSREIESKEPRQK